MKQLITMTACLMILMALLSQFVQNQTLLMQLEQGSHAVDLFCETGEENTLKASMAAIMDCETEEIRVQEQEGRILVSAPVKAVLASPSFWGIDPEENHGRYQWEREDRDE